MRSPRLCGEIDLFQKTRVWEPDNENSHPRQQTAARQRDKETARRWRRGLLARQSFILLLVALAALIPLYRTGFLPPLGQDRAAHFERLWRAVDAHYPYFEQTGVDWTAIRVRYRPRIEAAQSDEAYFAAIADMLAQLNDAHTGLIVPDAYHNRHYFGAAKRLDDGVVVDRAGETGRRAGLERGAALLAVDGLTVAEAMAALPPRLRSGSTPWQRQANAAFHLLSTPGDALEVTWETAVGEQRTVTLVWPNEPPRLVAAAATTPEALINGRRLPSGLGLIRIPSFSNDTGRDLAAEFDAALDVGVGNGRRRSRGCG